MIRSVLSLALPFSLYRLVSTSMSSSTASESRINYRLTSHMPSVFVNHGGGPMPLLTPHQYPGMKEHLGGLSQSYPKPKAVIVISAHWEEPEFTILDEDAPGLYFDYYGFPAEAYKYKYDATSTPELRQEVMAAVAEGGIKLKTKGKRGYDHGVFIPLMMIYPKADIPVIAISLQKTQKAFNPQRHYLLGTALCNLRKKGYMILGSGMSYHNMAGFGEPDAVPASKSFDEDLAGLCAKNGTHEERKNAVNNWTKMRHARECHPREEHLIPLFTCLGASDGKAGYQAKLWMLGVHVSDYVFE